MMRAVGLLKPSGRQSREPAPTADSYNHLITMPSVSQVVATRGTIGPTALCMGKPASQ